MLPNPLSKVAEPAPPRLPAYADIREYRAASAETRSVKVNLPAQLCVRLHAHKLFTGETIGETIERALEKLFRDESAADDAQPSA